MLHYFFLSHIHVNIIELLNLACTLITTKSDTTDFIVYFIYSHNTTQHNTSKFMLRNSDETWYVLVLLEWYD